MPGTHADERELLGIGEAIRRAGHGVFQFAPEHARVPVDEWPWMRELAARHRPARERERQPARQRPRGVARRARPARPGPRRRPAASYAQVAGRTIGILYCLQGSVHPLLFHPALPRDRRTCRWPSSLRALAEPERRRRIIEDVPDDGGVHAEGRARQARPHVARPTTATSTTSRPPTPASPRWPAAQGVPPMQLVLDQLTSLRRQRHDLRAVLQLQLRRPVDDLRGARSTRTPASASATPARTAAPSATAACPTFMLTHWTRDRTRGPKLPLEYVVHRQTAQTAALYGLGRPRRWSRPGMRADLNLIDYERLALRPATHGARPARRRPAAGAEGAAATWPRGAPACRPSPTTSSPARCRAACSAPVSDS